ncbi:MAG: PqqD family protein [Vicinamibacterales bacterium]
MGDQPFPDAVSAVRFAPDVVIRHVGNEALALKLTAEAAYSLNETAARVALLIADGLTVNEIVERLAAEYLEPTDLVSREVHRLIEDFRTKGLIELAHEGPSP